MAGRADRSERGASGDGLEGQVQAEPEHQHGGDQRNVAAHPAERGGAVDTVEPAARAKPMPPMTSAIPSPNATTRMNPNAGRPAAIEPSRMSRALVDGIRPPARPRTNRLRHEIVVPAGGRWLWLTPP